MSLRLKRKNIAASDTNNDDEVIHVRREMSSVMRKASATSIASLKKYKRERERERGKETCCPGYLKTSLQLYLDSLSNRISEKSAVMLDN